MTGVYSLVGIFALTEKCTLINLSQYSSSVRCQRNSYICNKPFLTVTENALRKGTQIAEGKQN